MNAGLVLLLALAGPPLLLLIAKRFSVDSLSWAIRIGLWVIAFAAFLCLLQTYSAREILAIVGLSTLSAESVMWGLAGAAALVIVTGAATAVQRLLKMPVGDHDTYARLVGLPMGKRSFVVVTASFVEEFLYRGIGIGIGGFVFGDVILAAVISLAAFTGAHFRWRVHHLIQVSISGAVLTALYIATDGDLWACIAAHFVIDAVGFLIVPTIIRRKNKSTS